MGCILTAVLYIRRLCDLERPNFWSLGGAEIWYGSVGYWLWTCHLKHFVCYLEIVTPG